MIRPLMTLLAALAVTTPVLAAPESKGCRMLSVSSTSKAGTAPLFWMVMS